MLISFLENIKNEKTAKSAKCNNVLYLAHLLVRCITQWTRCWHRRFTQKPSFPRSAIYVNFCFVVPDISARFFLRNIAVQVHGFGGCCGRDVGFDGDARMGAWAAGDVFDCAMQAKFAAQFMSHKEYHDDRKTYHQ